MIYDGKFLLSHTYETITPFSLRTFFLSMKKKETMHSSFNLIQILYIVQMSLIKPW